MILIDCDDVRIEHEIRNKKSDSSGRSNAHKHPHEVRKPVEINTDIITWHKKDEVFRILLLIFCLHYVYLPRGVYTGVHSYVKIIDRRHHQMPRIKIHGVRLAVITHTCEVGLVRLDTTNCCISLNISTPRPMQVLRIFFRNIRIFLPWFLRGFIYLL